MTNDLEARLRRYGETFERFVDTQVIAGSMAMDELDARRRATPRTPAVAAITTERLEQRTVATRRRRRTRRVVCVGAVTAVVVAVAVVISLPGRSRRDIRTPLRPVPTTVPTRIPDVSKTHAIVVTPSTGLRDRQIVRVSGRFGPGAEDNVFMLICRAGATEPNAFNDECDGTTSQASRLVPLATLPLRRYPYLVRRTITLGGQPVDCAAPPGCVLYAASDSHRAGHVYGVVPLAFDPVAPPLPGPTITVTPRDGLRDGDAVTVRAHHFRPFESVGVTLCVNGTDVCDAVGVPQQPVGPDGSLLLTHRVWPVFSSSDGKLQDCRSVACVVRFGSYDGSSRFDVPVSFAPGGPASYPTLTLDPAGPYTDGQPVTVTVQGWPGSIGQRPDLAIESLVIGQCTRPMSPGAPAVCEGETSPRRGSDGRYSETLPLHRTLSQDVLRGEPVDCTQPGNCRVALALTPRGPNAIPPHILVVILAVDVVVA